MIGKRFRSLPFIFFANDNYTLSRKSEELPVDREITVEQAIIIAKNQGYKIKSATA